MVKTARLNAGFAVEVSLEGGLGEPVAATVQNIGAWRAGRLVYVDAPLSALVADMRRYDQRAFVIADEGIGALTVTGGFDAGNIDGMLESLAAILPVDIATGDPQTVLISEKP